MADVEVEESLLFSPTWIIASVCTFFVLVSLILERFVFFIGHLLRTRKLTALMEAWEKIKEELMLVGFISIALTVGQSSIGGICIPEKWATYMRQCKMPTQEQEEATRKTLERILSTTEGDASGQPSCEEGKVHFMQVEGVHQLHILIFVLVIVHVFYSVTIMALGMWKVSQWKAWEKRSTVAEDLSVKGLRLTKDVTFIKRHAAGRWSKNVFLAYLAAFFQQFFKSVSETDYCTLRHGFIVKHKLTDFNFHTYLVRSLEEDFKYVVGIRPYLWAFTILVILLNVDGWKISFLAPLLPLIIVLIVGMKLRYIITEMAVQFSERNSVVEGIANVKPTDELFWFKKPQFILQLVHFVLFQDAFQVTIHLWSAYTFPNQNCMAKHPYVVLVRLLFGIFAQVICGYVMLPIYAIVSQMGSEIKHKAVMDDIEAMHKNQNPSEHEMSLDGNSVTVMTPTSKAHAQAQPLSVSSLEGGSSSSRDQAGPETGIGDDFSEPGGNAGKLERKSSLVQKTGRSNYQSLLLDDPATKQNV